MSRMQKTVASVIDVCIIGIIVEAFYHIMLCQICILVSHHITVPFIVLTAVKQFDKCKKKKKTVIPIGLQCACLCLCGL